MMGCLRWAVRGLLVFLILAGLALGWMYRDRLALAAHALRNGPPAGRVTGVPSKEGLERAGQKAAALEAGRADSVVLTPDEVASIMSDVVRSSRLGVPESVEVRLLEGAVEMRTIVETSRLPEGIPGFVRRALRPREPLEVVGALRMSGPGTVELRLDRLLIRGFPVPAELIGAMVARPGLPLRADGSLLVPLHPAVASLTVRPQGLVLRRERR
jgi:hypothetical protein